LKVAFQGERGAYSEMVARQHFGPNIEILPRKTLSDVFNTIESKKDIYAVVPIENSIEGSVNETYDLLVYTRKMVCNEIFFRIIHCLISYSNIGLDKIKSVYSHPQALAQCRNFLSKYEMEPNPFYDTAGSVKMLKDLLIDNAGAIASERAAEIYDMKVIKKGIENNKKNYTRFIVLASRDSQPTGNDKTLTIFTTKHVPGALHRVIAEFAARDINLTMIVSRPIKEKPWEYNFYLDFEGHREDPKVRECLKCLKSYTVFLKVLGSYPKFSQ